MVFFKIYLRELGMKLSLFLTTVRFTRIIYLEKWEMVLFRP